MTYKQQMAKWKARRDSILRMVKSGVSQAEIARQFGIKRQRVNQIVAERGKQ